MGELKRASGLRAGPVVVRRTFRVGWSDQPQLGVEDVYQIIEVTGAACVARCLAQLGLRPHLALDVGAGPWQERLEYCLRRLPVQPMLRICLG